MVSIFRSWSWKRGLADANLSEALPLVPDGEVSLRMLDADKQEVAVFVRISWEWALLRPNSIPMGKRCNFCMVQDAALFAKSIGGTFEVRRQVVCEADDQSSQTSYSASGVSVEVNGARFAWLASVPEQCVCD